MFGANYFGSLVFGAGLVVTSQTPVQPSSGSVAPYATHAYATGVFGAGQVVTSQTPVPPSGASSYAPIATHYYGAGVFGAGMVITSQTPVPPSPTGQGGGPVWKPHRRPDDDFAMARRKICNRQLIESAIARLYFHR